MSKKAENPIVLATEYIGCGEYQHACDILQSHAANGGFLSPQFAFAYARALKALSKYDEAEVVLSLAERNGPSTARALTDKAEIAWIKRDYKKAVGTAIEALNYNMFNRKAQIVRDRSLSAPDLTQPVQKESEKQLGHVAFYISGEGNYGDIVLPISVRQAYAQTNADIFWTPFHVHQIFDEECLEYVNGLDGLVIGGGGLFLPDTSPNGNSGWQWNIPTETLEAIDVPVAITAVGYNLFEGQSITGTTFERSLEALVDKCTVFGLRNFGSIHKVKELLPSALADKVSYMPCPTTVIDIMQPGITSRSDVEEVLINVAYDRANLRFGNSYDTFMLSMERYILRLRKAGIRVAFAAHLPRDETFVRDLNANSGINLKVYGLYEMSPEEGYKLYKGASLVVGMRGHATMIPFGLGTPVLSIISHPKMRYFLEDIEHTDWGVSVKDSQMGDQLIERTLHILDRREAIRKEIREIQTNLYRQVLDHGRSMLGT